MLLSTAFAAMIQTLRADPQMVKLIQNIPSANDGEQHKENTNNDIITKYLESNKDRILALTEKHYENLVDTLTNDSISNAAASFSNLTISLPLSSSSTFDVAPYKQSDIYGIEESDIHPDSKHNIAD
jgi:hypothetical protein